MNEPIPTYTRGDHCPPGQGKKLGRPRVLPANMHRTTVYLDDKTLSVLSSIARSTSEAIRILAAKVA